MSCWMFFSQVLIGLYQVSVCSASNWAQASGSISQNTVIPNYPSPSHPHWSARFGHATTVRMSSDLSELNYMYVMGGDSHHANQTGSDYVNGILDYQWETGYKNDVWRSSGTEWFVKGDMRLKSKYGRKVPRVESRLSWELLTVGLHPPPGMTNNEWIKCEPFFRNRPDFDPTECASDRPVQWSPRRHHSTVTFKDEIYVFGGRAREFVTLPHEYMVGGVLGPRVSEVNDSEANGLRFTLNREVSVLKSDVWKSSDGQNWHLVTPGCEANQKSLIAQGNGHEGKYGRYEKRCNQDRDCYGAEVCDQVMKTCVCSIWSPREQFAVAADSNYMYLSGGYASRLYSFQSNCGAYACGDTDAGSYRYYLSDVWRSRNGENWEAITESAFSMAGDPRYSVPLGRGGHSMLVLPDKQNVPYLWVIGGRGGDNSNIVSPIVYYNDIWTAPLSGAPITWTILRVPDKDGVLHDTMPWEPRSGHGVILEDARAENKYTRALYIYGGENNGTFFSDTWGWQIDWENEYWKKDFTPEAYYTTGLGEDVTYETNSPAVNYVYPDADISYLKRFWVPAKPGKTPTPYEERPYINEEDMETIRSLGINTIKELAEIDVYDVVRLRGYDFPQVSKADLLHVPDICNYRALAIALVEKCSLNLPSLYNGEKNMPWNIIPKYGGATPKDHIAWHQKGDKVKAVKLHPVVNWDGCSGDTAVDVNGIGMVPPPPGIRDPFHEAVNLFCRQSPGPRAFHTMTHFEGRTYVIGGRYGETKFFADSWYRDAKLPQALIRKSPKSRTSSAHFYFASDKAGAYYEYRLWDPYNYKEVRPWNAVVKKAGVSWLNWREGGPGSGRYQLFVRTVDPAGNRDASFRMGENVYIWFYVSPTPWDIIFGVLGGVAFLFILAYLEYRRREKKAAMERYAMKRMRRKFKAMQRDIDGKAVDWRTLYVEAKQEEEAGMRERKRLQEKKIRDRQLEKREKEKLKREKEKDMIKKKLRANKLFKEKTVIEGNRANKQYDVNIRQKVVPTNNDNEYNDDENMTIDARMKMKQRERPVGSDARVISADGLVSDTIDSDTNLRVTDKETQLQQRKGKMKPYEVAANDFDEKELREKEKKR